MSTALQEYRELTALACPRPKRIRVLYFDHTAVLSGGELALLETIRNLDRTLIEPIILLGEHGPLEAALGAEAPTHVIEMAGRLRNTRKDSLTGATYETAKRVILSIPYILKLTQFIRSARPDVIHTNSLKADLLGGIAARLAGVPLVWHVRDRVSPDYLPGAAVSLFRNLVQWIPNYVIGCSESVIETLHLPPSKPRAVVYSGIDLAEYESKSTEPRGLLDPTDHTSVPILIGLVGRLGSWKGQHIFIESAVEVHRQFPKTRFLLYGSAMFGEAEYEQSLHRLVKELGLDHAVEFRGFERNIAQAIANLDILVHASISPEPFGQVIVQGMAAGKPVIASEGGGASEIIRHGVDGLLVERGNPQALATALCLLLSDDKLVHRLSVQGRERVRSKFTIQETVQTMTRVFQELVQQA